MSETYGSSAGCGTVRESTKSRTNSPEGSEVTSQQSYVASTAMSRINRHIILQDAAFMLFLITSQRRKNLNAVANICEAYIQADTLGSLHKIRWQMAKTVCVLATKKNPQNKDQYDHTSIQYRKDCEYLYTQLAAQDYLYELDRELRISTATAVKRTIPAIKPGFSLSDTAAVFQDICTCQGVYVDIQDSVELTNLATSEIETKISGHKRMRDGEDGSLHAYSLSQLPEVHEQNKRRRITHWVHCTYNTAA